VTLARKSPPFAQGAKDGAPSSSVVVPRDKKNPADSPAKPSEYEMPLFGGGVGIGGVEDAQVVD